jgi:hypothetical protein
MQTSLRVGALMLLSIAIATKAHAQLLTVPQALARAGESLSGGQTSPSGPLPTLDRILLKTDLIVSGVIGESRSYLSDDQMDVRTDYEILAPVILYESVAIPAGQLHTRPVTVTMLGGVVTINGLTFTSTHDALPRLQPGTEALFLLRQIGSRFFIGGAYYGVFGMLGGKLMPLSTKPGFAPELYDLPVAQASDEIVRRVTALRNR